MYRYLIVFYLIIFTLAISSRILENFADQTTFLFVIYKILNGATYGFIVGALINNGMHLWEYFKSDFYGDRSYLTHTLPLAPRTLYLSKILTAFITIFTSLTVFILAILILFSGPALTEFFNYLTTQLNHSNLLIFLITAALLIYLEFVTIIISGITGIIIGYRANNAKLLLSIIAGLIIYGIVNAITVPGILLCGIFNPEIIQIFTDQASFNLNTALQIFLSGIISYSLIIVAQYFISTNLLNRGVNVD